jgi:hypothetical protein
MMRRRSGTRSWRNTSSSRSERREPHGPPRWSVRLWRSGAAQCPNRGCIRYLSRPPRAGETLCGTRCHMGFAGKGANRALPAYRTNSHIWRDCPKAITGCWSPRRWWCPVVRNNSVQPSNLLFTLVARPHAKSDNEDQTLDGKCPRTVGSPWGHHLRPQPPVKLGLISATSRGWPRRRATGTRP